MGVWPVEVAIEMKAVWVLSELEMGRCVEWELAWEWMKVVITSRSMG